MISPDTEVLELNTILTLHHEVLGKVEQSMHQQRHLNEFYEWVIEQKTEEGAGELYKQYLHETRDGLRMVH